MKHKVLIISQKMDKAEDYSHPNAEIHLVYHLDKFSQLEEIQDYNLIILNFDAFNQNQDSLKEIEYRFQKKLIEFFKNGGTLCLLHYKEPNISAVFGVKYLSSFGIGSNRDEDPNVDLIVLRNEFNTFLTRWGASHYTFVRRGPIVLSGICDVKKDTIELMGFSFPVKKGRILCLPFQNTPNKSQIDAVNSLVDSILTYLSSSNVQFPKWAGEPFFDEELSLNESIETHKNELKKLDDKINIYNQVKTLMLLRNYELEDFTVIFLQENLSLRINRNERFIEDFWIQNNDGDNIIIGEIKSFTKGFKKTGIYSICSHREENNLEEDFPALLIVNQNLQAGSWKLKEQPILQKDYELSFKENVLICRTEDLVRLWKGLNIGKFSTEEVLNLLINSKGWIEINKSLEVKIHH